MSYPTWTRWGRHVHGSQDASALLCQDYDQSGHCGDDQSASAVSDCILICLQHFGYFGTWAFLVSPHLPHSDSPWQPGEHLLEDPFGSVVKGAWSWRLCSSIWSLWGQITWSFVLQQLWLNHKAPIISAVASEIEHGVHSRCNCRHEWFRTSNPLTCATAQRGEWNLQTISKIFKNLTRFSKTLQACGTFYGVIWSLMFDWLLRVSCAFISGKEIALFEFYSANRLWRYTHTHTKLSLALRACEVQCETEKRFAMFQALSKRSGVNSPIKLVRARNHCSQAGYKHDGINTPCCNAQLLLSNAVIINKSSSHLHIVVHTLFCEELSAVGEVGVMLQHKPWHFLWIQLEVVLWSLSCCEFKL